MNGDLVTLVTQFKKSDIPCPIFVPLFSLTEYILKADYDF